MGIILKIVLPIGLGFFASAFGRGVWDDAAVQAPALLMVAGGTLAALLIQFPLATMGTAVRAVLGSFDRGGSREEALIEQFKRLATAARRGGLIALEDRIDELEEPLLRQGVNLIVEGGRAEELEKLAASEGDRLRQAGRGGARVFRSAAKGAMTSGVIGGLLFLMQQSQGSSSAPLTAGILSAALLPVMYGVALARLICTPLAGRIEDRLREELALQTLVISGLSGLLEDHAPAQIEQRLLSFTAHQAARRKAAA